ncbi:MAG: dTDP-4-dehydrorhamnose 3,5-epimerase [Bacteroidota bacterium]
MGFKLTTTALDGLLIIDPDVFGDERGYFKELFNKQTLAELGFEAEFVQDNLSYSQQGALRGLHFQAPPHAQGKLVFVTVGKVLDVVVDIRKSSATYGQSLRTELSADNHRMLYVPPGFAHGFSVLSPDCIFQYKCTNYYNKASEGGILWNDPQLNIDWQVDEPIVSDKDRKLPTLSNFDSPFE